MTMEEALQLAKGYSWGRADSGKQTVDGGPAFAVAFAAAQGAYNCGTSSYMPSVQQAWFTWQRTLGRLVIPADLEEATDEPA